MTPDPLITPVLLEEAVGNDATHCVEIYPEYFEGLVADATKVFVVETKAGERVRLSQARGGFLDTRDAANDSVLVKAGTADAADAYLAQSEVGARNAAFKPGYAGKETPVTYDAAGQIKIEFTPKAGKSLGDLNSGLVRLYFKILPS